MLLDEWQQFTLEAALGERKDGSWAAFEVGDFVSRQNGKGDTIQAREAAGLFLLGEQLIIHTAHEFATANEAFLRMVTLIESNRDLERKVQRIRFANGEQGIELKSGQRLKYRARTGGAGRGFAGADLVVYDEAFALHAEHVAASLPTLSTSPNPQVWFASSGALAYSTQIWSMRKRALAGNAGRLAYAEHTAEVLALDEKGKVVSQPLDISDRRNWAIANPAAGYRITWEYLEAEYAAMPADQFARERLGKWDPLAEDLEEREVKLPADRWALTVVDEPPDVQPGEPSIAWDVSLDGEWASIAIGAGTITNPYVEIVEHRQGTGWLAGRLVELVQRWKPTAVGCNGAGPAGAQVAPVLQAFRDASIDANLLRQMTAAEYKQACGGFYLDVVEDVSDDISRPRLRRPDNQGPLDNAAGDATERPLGDAWAWDLRQATVPISPLVAVTIARALLPVEAPAAKPVFAY